MNMFQSEIDRTPSPGNRAGVVPTPEKPSIFQQYWGIALRWRWVIIGVTALWILIGLIATLLMTPQYTAGATIEISRESDKVVGFQGVEREASVADQEFYQTQYGLLSARSLAERVASELRLVDDPAFFEMFDIPADDPGFEMAANRYRAEGRAERQRRAGEVLLKNVSIDPARLSRLVEIRFTSPDPAFSARVANSWAENFITTNLERKVQSTSYGRDALQRQLAEYKDRLDQSQRQLVAYASAQEIINLPSQTGGNGTATQERSIVADDLSAINSALAEATADRIRAEARFRQNGRAGFSLEALTNQAINNLRQRRAELAAEYQQMMVRFEPGYPAAKALQDQINELDLAIGREEVRVTRSLEADFRAARQREQALLQRVNELKGDFLDLRRRSIQYNIFQQEVDTNRVLYDGLLQRFKEIGVAGGVGVNNVAIVDLAFSPQKPSSPKLLINILGSILLGLGMGAAIAFVLEQLDESIVDPTELASRLGLPLLGSVPKVKGADSPKDALLDPKSDLFDAYLAVQASLGFTTEFGVPRSLSVTSTRPAEGKSTTALALATMLTRAKRRVILVDGDMRSPSVHQLGGVGHEKGLSNFLSGEDAIEELVFQMPGLGFSAMSAGPIPPNAAELLSGHRLSIMIERLLETYDNVVVDSPPVMGLADAPLIASQVDGVVFAVESHGIRSSQVKTALARLMDANAHVLGGVLTKFDAGKAHRGYGYDYGYDYGRGDEKVAEA
jgi:succinoglycan biosynthesis transport protein ExoP